MGSSVAESARLKILFVDDNDSTLSACDVAAGHPDYEVETAASGLVALVKARVFMPNVILLEARLPDMSGLAFLRLLRMHSMTKDIPAILSLDASWALVSGPDTRCFAVVPKPRSLDGLACVIARAAEPPVAPPLRQSLS